MDTLGIEGIEVFLLLASLMLVCFFMEKTLQQMFFPVIAAASIPLAWDTIVPVYRFLDKFNGLNGEMIAMLWWATGFMAIFWVSLLMSLLVYKKESL